MQWIEKRCLLKIEKKREEIQALEGRQRQEPFNAFLLFYAIARLKKKMLLFRQQWHRLRKRRLAQEYQLYAYEEECRKKKKQLEEDVEKSKEKVPVELLIHYLETLKNH